MIYRQTYILFLQTNEIIKNAFVYQPDWIRFYCMAAREYSWTDMDNPPKIGRHSLNKHEVLQNYLRVYLDKLCARAHESVRCSLIDGFSGGGIYKRPDNGEIYFGSPVIIMETVADCENELAIKHGKKVEIKARYYFVEKNKQYFSLLKKVLDHKNLNPIRDGKGGCFNGEFERLYPNILESIKSEGKSHKAIFILDQFGYKDVPMMTIQQIFKDLPHSEIILTFAVDWLIDYLSSKPGEHEKWQARFEALGIGCKIEDLLDIKNNVPYSRLIIQDLLSEEISRNCGAKYYTRYFIQTERPDGRQSHRSIWLVHMSMHEVARDEMVKVHWGAANHLSKHSGYSGIDDRGTTTLGYTTKYDARLGQLNLDYNFDVNAESISIEVLLNQIPNLLWKKNRCTFSSLMAEIANHTPVSSETIRKVLNVLINNKDISIISKEGALRQRGSAIKWTDVINTKQRLLFDYSTNKTTN